MSSTLLNKLSNSYSIQREQIKIEIEALLENYKTVSEKKAFLDGFQITSSDPKIIAEVISKYSLYDYYCSSSMEFASEHGFPNNNSAMKLFDKAEKLNSKLRGVK